MEVCMGRCKAGPSKGHWCYSLGRGKVPLVQDIRWEQMVSHLGGTWGLSINPHSSPLCCEAGKMALDSVPSSTDTGPTSLTTQSLTRSFVWGWLSVCSTHHAQHVTLRMSPSALAGTDVSCPGGFTYVKGFTCLDYQDGQCLELGEIRKVQLLSLPFNVASEDCIC